MSDVVTVEFFFDPGCPWTWQTATWLRGLGRPVRWRAFRLELLSSEPLPAAWVDSAAASEVALRAVEHLAAAGRHDDAGRFYAALGTALHDDGRPPSAALVRSVAVEFGDDVVAALDDRALDDVVRAAMSEAQALVGPGLGSPVLALTFADGRRRGIFGPIVTGALDATDATTLWDATAALLRIDRFSEMKRGRSLYGDLHPSLTPHV